MSRLHAEMTIGEIIGALAADAPGCRFLIETAITQARQTGAPAAELLVLSQLDELELYGADIMALYMDTGENITFFLADLSARMEQVGASARG